MKKSSRILAFVLTLLMVVSLMPVSALADELAPASAAESLLLPGMVDIPAIEETETPVATETPAPTEAPAETEQPEATEAPVLPELDVVLPEVGSAADAAIDEAAETEEEAPVEDVEEAAEDGANEVTTADYLFIATDRHANTSIIGSIINNMESAIGENELDYLGLGGDMVGSGNSHPSYNSSTVLGEVTGATSSLSATNVDIVAGIHDMNVTDDAGIVLPYKGGGAKIYEGDRYYVYGVEEYCISEDSTESIWSAQAEAFVKWATNADGDGVDIDTSKVIIVVSHYPLHAKRGDNAGAGYWHNALNEVATGSATGKEVIRNVVFFHGHNHTVDTNEYYYEPGSTMAIQSYIDPSGVATAAAKAAADYDYYEELYDPEKDPNAGIATAAVGSSSTNATASGTDATIYYTYATAGYLNENKNATLVTITDDTITLTKYTTSGSGTAMGDEIKRVAETTTLSGIAISGTTEYSVGDELALTVTATYSDGSTKDVTEDAEITGYDMSSAGTYTVTATYGEKTATTSITVTVTPKLNTITAWDNTDSVSVQATALGLSDMTVTNVYGDSDLSSILSNYMSVDVALTGVTSGTEITYSMLVLSDIPTAGLVLYHVAEDGTPTPISYTLTTSVSGGNYLNFTTPLTGTFAYGTPAVPEGYVLARLTVTMDETNFFVGDTLPAQKATVTLVYTKDDAEDYTRVILSGYDVEIAEDTMTTVGTKTVVYSFTENDVTATGTLAITVWQKTFPDETTGVSVEVNVPGATELTVAPSENTNVAEAIQYVIEDGTYVAYDIELAGYNDGESVIVTLPIPEGVTNPVVYYVSDDGKTVTNMNATVNEDGTTVSFTTDHFSTWIIGETTEITVPENVTATGSGTTTEKKTVYVLTSSISSNNSYLIADSASAGDVHLVANDGGDLSNTTSTVIYGDCDGDGDSEYYIELTDATDELWTVASGYTFQNSSYYLGYTTSGDDRNPSYSFGLSTTARNWSYSSNNRLSTSVGDRNSTTYYLCYNSGWTWTSSNSASGRRVYFYVPTEIDDSTTKSGTYSIEGEDISTAVSEGSTAKLTSTLIFEPDEDNTATVESPVDVSTTATYEIVTVDINGNTVDGDPNDIISKIENGVVTFTGNYGTALVKVSYPTDFGDVTDYITIEATAPYYTIDLCEPVTDADGNTTYESITATVPLKSIAANDTYSVWAVIKEHTSTNPDGADLGDVEDDRILWTVSNTAIAKIDPATGVLTFTGEQYGTIIVSAHYLDNNGEILCSDSIVISVSATSATVPNDGTDDFPDYPNEGAVRHDKTATAVGNFSETGIAKVELSMTGVPYTTGSEIDVVVMLDMTGSMSDDGMEAAEEATKAFVKEIVVNEDGSYNENRIAVYAFNSGSDSPYELVALDTISSDADLETANTAIDTASDKQASGGTPFDEAAQKCYDVLQAAKTDGTGHDRQQFCVFMSDGGPTTYEGSDGYTYYGGNNNSGDRAITSYIDGYTSSTASDWTYNLPTEYYTDQMKADGVTVYTVGLLLQNVPSSPSPYSSMTSSTYDSTTDSLTTIGSHYYFTSTILKNMATDTSKYIDIFNVDNADKATAAFESIAKDILAAATDVTVADKIGSDYTMVFDAPNAVVDAADGGQEYYIEVTDYPLEPVYATDGVTITDYVRGTGTSLLKLYFGYDEASGYYAATDASGTKAATPTFDKVTLGDKGTKYYWTTVSTEGDSDVSVVGEDGTTYYFVSTGDGTHNMTAGAYASGTNTTVTLTYDDETTGESVTCQNMIIATPYFVYNAATKMLIWTLEEIADNEITLTYFLYLNNSGGFSGTEDEIEPETYETNQFAYVNYTNFQKTECQLTFPVPQMTWNGAQVSYTFYLVNENGQPVNRAGRVVPFSEAIYVTDVFTYAIVWNDLEQAAGLEAERLAEDLVPDVYALYDAGAAYNIHVYEDFEEVNLNNHFVISSSVDTDSSAANNGIYTTYVFNTKADATKYTEPGVYVADNGNNTAYESGQTYWCKSYEVTGTFEKTEHTDEVYGTYYTYTVTSATYSGSQTQVRATSMKSTTGGTIIGDYVYYVDENEQIYTIVQKTDGNEVEAGFDFSNTTVAFAVVWKPELKEDVVVIDYGLDVVVDVIATDSLAAGVVGVRTDAPSGITINSGTYEAAEAKSVDISLNSKKIGMAIVESEDAVRFSLDQDNGMQMSAPVKFYYEAAVNYYDDNVLKTDNMYSSVTVIPATSIYYEDSFVSFKDGSGGDTGTWSAETTQGGTQDMDRPGPDKIGTVNGTRQDADNVYGYDSAYDNMATYSMGSARYVTVSADNNPSKGGTWPTAEFTFTGTGFDIISMTDNTTGTIFVKVYKVTDGVAETEATRSWVVDTFYGYTRTLNGEYPAIKYTWLYNSNGEWRVVEEELVETKGNDEDMPANPVAGETTFVTYEDNYVWTITTGENSLYQIPVIKHSGLDYGTYKVVIQPTFSTAFDNAGTGSYDFYLDAIRIYDPAGVVSGDNNPTISEEDSVSGVYKEDSEGWPEYVELRDQILAQGAFDTTEDNITGAVFIDGDGISGTFSDYEVIGPNHEVYLASNQAIAFKLATETPALVADVQLGVKALDGDVSITVAEVGGEEVSLEDISTTTDMYYSIIDCVTWGDTPDTHTGEYYSGVIVITNTSEEDILVSLTNVKMTYTDTPTTSGFGLRMSRESAVEAAAYVADITADGVVEENSGTNTGDDVNDDTTGTEGAPGDEESGGDAGDDTTGDDTTGDDTTGDDTTEEENDTTSAAVSLINTVNKIMQSIRNVLSSILGWLGR